MCKFDGRERSSVDKGDEYEQSSEKGCKHYRTAGGRGGRGRAAQTQYWRPCARLPGPVSVARSFPVEKSRGLSGGVSAASPPGDRDGDLPARRGGAPPRFGR